MGRFGSLRRRRLWLVPIGPSYCLIPTTTSPLQEGGEPLIQRSGCRLHSGREISGQTVRLRLRSFLLCRALTFLVRLTFRTLLIAKTIPAVTMLGAPPLDAVPFDTA
ncbi:hypothetical protein [Sphingobium lactosutens]|uniref:hypothetical protein n=1 Tax=Sphingobium lactosutens TaxID=522773 RepID=UPI001376F713|nr:hypothetical protein [Sphingobium lactosutens]